MRSRALVLSAVFAAAVGVSACDIKAGESGGFSMDFAAGRASDTWTRTYKVASGGRVELINVNGKITAEPASGDSVELVGERTVKASSDEAAKELLGQIEMKEEVGDASVRVEVRNAKFGGRMFGFNNAQIKWTVKVPKGVEVRLQTTNGGVELIELANIVRAKTTNGGVVGKRLAATDVEASSVNGGVEIELTKALPPEGRVELETVNGGVGLELPETSRATINARAVNGGVKVLELDVDVQGEPNRRRLEGTLNGGGAHVNLSTTNGGVRVARASGRPTS